MGWGTLAGTRARGRPWGMARAKLALGRAREKARAKPRETEQAKALVMGQETAGQGRHRSRGMRASQLNWQTMRPSAAGAATAVGPT